MDLSPNFTLRELTRSQVADRHGIDNAPGPKAIAALRELCAFVLEPVRANFGSFTPSSGYRSPEVNALIGGAAGSQHVLGQAADFEVQGVSNLKVAEWIWFSGKVDFDQLILEFYTLGRPDSGWVHCSYVSPSSNRGECLTATKRDGRTQYLRGLVP